MSDDEKVDFADLANPTSDLSRLSYKDLLLAVGKMNVGQKQLLALKGGATIRRILLRDPNVEVQLAIVNSPKTSESEIEQIAGLPASTEVVLQAVFSDGRWAKSYRIKLALAKNPKTPLSIANRCLKSLTPHDLRKLSIDPYMRKPIAQTALRMLNSYR